MRHRGRRRAAAARLLASTLAVVLLAPTVAVARPDMVSSAAAATYPGYCRYTRDPVARADELLANRYVLSPHPLVELPADLRWNEDPLGDRNWQFQFHAMRFVLDLFVATDRTGEAGYRDRGLALLQDWVRDNPRLGAPSAFSWNDHSTALRAIVLACAADLTPMTTWLRNALDLHGRMLANPTFYVGVGNHALNQSIGLLEVARVLKRADWKALARDRINALVLRSVDAQGVANEGSVFYQTYNYARYRVARDRMRAMGITLGSGFSRVDLMPRFIAMATLPDGRYEMIGDTEATPAPSYPGTWTEYVATKGASGPRPPTVAVFDAGYLFSHSGWGGRRAFADETFLSLRWGPGPRVSHQHADGTSLTLYGWGTRLLVDPGKYSYDYDAYRSYFVSRRAHNVVTVDGSTWNRAASTSLVAKRITSTLIDLRLRTVGDPGVVAIRRVTYSRALDYVLVEDRLASEDVRTYRQLWHLVDGSAPTVGASTVVTMRDRGNVLIRQLAGRPALRVLTGETSPVQGWISYRWEEKVEAPVVEAVQSGRSVRYLTLIVPSEGSPVVSVRDVRITSGGYSATITVNGRSERVVVSGASATITPLG